MSEANEVLLVEDNLGDVKLTKKAFERGKFINNLSVARDGEEALNFLYKRENFQNVKKPDLILLDLNLPKLDGREVLATIKKEPKLKEIPVIILTTSENEEDILHAYAQRANCYIKKPVEIDRFFEVIRSIENFWFSIVKLPTLVSRGVK